MANTVLTKIDTPTQRALPVRLVDNGDGTYSEQFAATLTATIGALSMADGNDVAEGALADAIVAAGATGSISAKLRRVTQGLEDLKTLLVLAAGSHIIGKVGIDQTTPGTTNAVVVNGSTTLYDGTFAAGSAAALPSHACTSVVVQNDPSNATGQDIYIGNATTQSVRLQPGQTIAYSVNNANLVYVTAVSGTPRVNWQALS